MSWYLWYPEVLKKYAVFSGRAHRKEYWFFFLVNVLIALALGVIDGLIGISGDANQSVLVSLYWLAVLVPSIAVGVRRLHDTGRSGWWMLLGLVPIVGLVLLVFLVLDGQRGPNAYGPDPKGRSLAYDPGRIPPVAPPSPPQSGPAGDAPGQQPPAQRPPAPPLQAPPAAPDVPSPPPSSADEEQKPPPSL